MKTLNPLFRKKISGWEMEVTGVEIRQVIIPPRVKKFLFANNTLSKIIDTDMQRTPKSNQTHVIRLN